MEVQNKIGIYNQKLKQIVERNTPGDGIFQTAVPSLFFVRKKQINQTDKCFVKPHVSVVLQGHKISILGNQEYHLEKNKCIVSGVDAKSSSNFLVKEPYEEFLSLFFYLDREMLSELILEMEKHNIPYAPSKFGFSVGDVDVEILECLYRLAELVDKPGQISLRAPMILRELHYLVLIGKQGGVLYGLYAQGSDKNNVMQAISFLKENVAEPLIVEELAKKVHMSVSSLYRHFKDVTGSSPLQYQKQLRLYEAQRLMFMENEKASVAALRVGYESVTQFNREYKRMFGEPPHRDMTKRKNSFWG